MQGRRRLEAGVTAVWLLAAACGSGATGSPDAGLTTGLPGAGGSPDPAGGDSSGLAPSADGPRGWPDGPLPAGAAVLALGPAEAATPAGSIARVTGDTTGAYGWGLQTGYERPGDPEGFYPYAGPEDLPDGGKDFLGFRPVVPAYPLDVLIPGGSRSVAFEYKDNLFSPRLDPYRPKGDGPRVEVGGIDACEWEAKRDHQWKRVVCEVPAAAPKEPDGRYRVRVGGGTYGANELYGSALVHRVIAAAEPIPARGPVAGFWPPVAEYARDGRLVTRDGQPYVPLITNITASQTAYDQIDALSLIGANTQLVLGSAEGAGNRGWGDTEKVWLDAAGARQRQFGIERGMKEALARDSSPVPWNGTDTWQYYIGHLGRDITSYGGDPYRSLYNGTWRGVVAVWKEALTRLVKDNPNVPFIYLKDEWDHENQWWGSYEEQIRELRHWANRLVPGVPTVVTSMGWKTLMHRAAFDLADVQMTDRYPAKADLNEVARWTESMRLWADGRAYLYVLPLTRAFESSPPSSEWLRLDYLRPGAYIALVHGARGLWFFGDPASMGTAEGREYFASLKPLLDELRALEDVIHGSAAELGRTTATITADAFPTAYQAIGDGTSGTDGVATAYRQAAGGGRKVLLAVNVRSAETLTARLRVAGIVAGDRIPVLFEGRAVVADRDGSFEDSFPPFERHVYQIPR